MSKKGSKATAIKDKEDTSLLGRASSRLSLLLRSGRQIFAAAAPTVVYLSDLAWFAGSAALLLTLPMLVEIQRETTVLVMQKQREAEIAQIQEQAKHSNAGVVEQMKGFGSLIASSTGQ